MTKFNYFYTVGNEPSANWTDAFNVRLPTVDDNAHEQPQGIVRENNDVLVSCGSPQPAMEWMLPEMKAIKWTPKLMLGIPIATWNTFDPELRRYGCTVVAVRLTGATLKELTLLVEHEIPTTWAYFRNYRRTDS